MNELGIPDDMDKRLQRQLLMMLPEEAEAYAALVGGVIEHLLPPKEKAADNTLSGRLSRAV